MAKKWNEEKKEHEDYILPEGAVFYGNNMNKKISCARCGKTMLFGDGYTSRQIYNESGAFGYSVCKKCYDLEWKESKTRREDDIDGPREFNKK